MNKHSVFLNSLIFLHQVQKEWYYFDTRKRLKINRKGGCEKDAFKEAASTKNIQRPNRSSHKTEGEVRRTINQNTKANGKMKIK